MSLLDYLKANRPAPSELGANPAPVDPASILHVAVLAIRYGKRDTALHWSWAVNCDARFALGHALKSVGNDGIVIGKTVFEIPVASGTEAGTVETEGFDPKDDGPTAESGDAPPLASHGEQAK